MHKFYDDLKEYILNHDEPTKKILIPYYETLFQLENCPEMKELLVHYQENDYNIDFNESDVYDYRSNGWLEIYEQHNPVSYTIELDVGYDQGDYCQCKPSDEGYNTDKSCCGLNCEARLPKVSIVKEVKMKNHEFQGYERDLWALEEKWLTDYEREALQKKKVEKVYNLKMQIEQLQKELKVVESQL